MGKIERAGMDGSHREVIVQGSVRWPNGLALDLVLDRLYWVDAKLSTIGSSALDGSEARIILFSTSTLRHPFSIAVFEDFMYWSEWESRTIYKADKFSGKNVTAITGHLGQLPMVVEEGVVTADGLAVDWVHLHLYWTDTGTNTISVSDYQGNQRATLVSDSLEEPRAIALHPGKGWMFWSDWGREPKIERAGMDGSHREVIVQGSVRWPNGLALDL